MDDAFIFDFLPAYPGSEVEINYIDFLKNAFISNYKNSIFQFSFLAYHMLFMSFFYFELWKIKQNCPNDFEKALIGFNNDHKKKILKSNTPFILSILSESNVFKILKHSGMIESDIEKCKAIVKSRNESAHANGNVFYQEKDSFIEIISKIDNCIKNIKEHSTHIITELYRNFLLENASIEMNPYSEIKELIDEDLIRKNYLSKEDIRIILKFDFETLKDEPKYDEMKCIVDEFKSIYDSEENQ